MSLLAEKVIEALETQCPIDADNVEAAIDCHIRSVEVFPKRGDIHEINGKYSVVLVGDGVQVVIVLDEAPDQDEIFEFVLLRE